MLKSKNKLKPERPPLAALHEFRPKGREQWGMFLIGMAVACYFTFVILSKAFLLLPHSGGWLVWFLFPVLAPAIYWLMCFLLHRFQEKPEAPKQAFWRRLRALRPTLHSTREKLSPLVFFGAFFVVFAVLGIGLLANYPGGFGITDLGWQWMQVQTGQFDDWHPAIHSMLIWLLTRIVNSHGFVIAVQILFFSLLCGYMAATLRAWGLQKGWVALYVLAVVSTHSIRGIMLYIYKDSLFICFILWATVCLINVALSHGKWLGRWDNRVAFAVALALVNLIRITGFLFTIPVAVLLCVFYAKKQTVGCVVSGALALLLIAGVKGPLYTAAGVIKFENKTHMDLTHPPMVILATMYYLKPGAFNEDGRRFMQYLATPEQWASMSDSTSVFQSVRGVLMPPLPQVQEMMGSVLDDYAAQCPPKKMVSIFWHAVKNEPVLAMQIAAATTNYIWDPTAIHHTIGIYPDALQMVLRNDSAINAQFDNHQTGIHLRESILAESRMPHFRAFQVFKTPYHILEGIFRTLTPGRLLQCIGLNLLALMLCMWISLRRRMGFRALLLGLPMLSNSLSFLIMVIDIEYRLFLPTAIMTPALALIFLAKNADQKKVKADYAEKQK